MNIREQEYILELDRFRSITRAAEELHITQPALSIFLSNLEKNQGAPLFERVGKTLVPTPIGEAYIRCARQIAALRNDYELEKAELIRGMRGSLRIGGLQMRNLYLMPELLGRFRQAHPEIETSLYSGHHDELIDMLLDGSLDMIFTNRSEDYSGLHREPVVRDNLLLVLPQGHPASGKAVQIPGQSYPYLDLKAVSGETFFLAKNGQTLRRLADQAMAYCGCTGCRSQTLEYIQLCCQMAAEGLGAAFTMESYARDFQYRKKPDFFLTGNIAKGVTWNIFWRESTVVPVYMEDFIALLKENA